MALLPAELRLQCRSGAHHGLRVLLFALGVALVMAIPLLGQRGSRGRVASGGASAGFLLLSVTVALVAGSAAASSLARDQAAGGLDLLLLAGQRPASIVATRLAATLLPGALLLAQCLLLASVAGSQGVAVAGLGRSLATGALVLVTVASLSIWGQLVSDASRPGRHVAEAAVLAALLLGAPVAARRVALGTSGALLLATLLLDLAALALSVRILARAAPEMDEHDEDRGSLRRRLSRRTMSGRDISWPVLEAARIPTRRSMLPYAVAGTSLLVTPLAALARQGEPRATELLVLGIGCYLPAVALLFARETMAVNPSTAGFAMLAVTPLPAYRILLERAAGKALRWPLLGLPLLALAAIPAHAPQLQAAGLLALLAASALAFGAALAARTRRSGGGIVVLDLFLLLLLMLAIATSTDRFLACWLTSRPPPEVGLTLALALLELAGALLALPLAAHHLELARRHVP